MAPKFPANGNRKIFVAAGYDIVNAR
jgi:hypothetical protein